MEIKSVKWYQWLFGAISIPLLLLLIQNLVGTFAEGEPQAFWPLFLMLGLPLIVCLYLTFGLRPSLKNWRK